MCYLEQKDTWTPCMCVSCEGPSISSPAVQDGSPNLGYGASMGVGALNEAMIREIFRSVSAIGDYLNSKDFAECALYSQRQEMPCDARRRQNL